MQQNRFNLLLILAFLGLFNRLAAQSPIICNDLVYFSISSTCYDSITAEALLEGALPDPSTLHVDLDRTPPAFNGPWTTSWVNANDVGKTYGFRVVETTSGNSCWGTIKIEDKIPPQMTCNELVTVNLTANSSAVLSAASLPVTVLDNCATNVGIQINNGLSVLNLNCNNLGVNQITVTATDNGGNTVTCQMTVLVEDPLQVCTGGGCITDCPASQVVSYEHGMYTLLPALQASDLAPFSGYGFPDVDSGCQPSDTTHQVTYLPTAAGFNSFLREWNILLGGTPFGRCRQYILFPSNRSLELEGTIFLDSIPNCLNDPGETGTSLFPVVVTRFPSNATQSVFPDNNGDYNLQINLNGLDSAVSIRLVLPQGVTTACPNVFYVPANTPDLQQVHDFGLFANSDCPFLEVSMSTNRLRPCTTSTYVVQYLNRSLTIAEDAYVIVTLDSLLDLTGASIPYTQSGDEYIFQLGDVLPLKGGTFTFSAMVDCDAMPGQTLCAEAEIFPHLPCGQFNWMGPIVATNADCTGDSVRLTVRNTGQMTMAEMLNFIVIEDVLLRDSSNFILDPGQDTILTYAANGNTWRIIAEQIEGYPFSDRPSSFVEGCNGFGPLGAVNAFAHNEDDRFVDVACIAVTASFDPNDKSAVPTGYGPDHIIWPNIPLEYTVRFQNTGTDTAFLVVIADTLSAFLDHASLEAGVASHPYNLEVREGGILNFVFQNIQLPDSTTNLAGSQGFVQYRIKQRADLPIGTLIENKAAIYFDFNDPIITNTVWHNVGLPSITVSAIQPHLANLKAVVAPNPFTDQAVLQLQGYEATKGQLTIHDQLGRVVSQQTFTGSQCRIDGAGMPSGLYFFQVKDSGRLICSGQLVVH